jgi:predicted ATPase
VESYDVTRHRHLGAMFGGHDPGVCAHVVFAMGLRMSGDSEPAKESMARGLDLAETLDDPASVAHALATLVFFHQFVADREATLEIARRLGALAEKFGLMPHRPVVLLLSAWANATGSGAAEAARLIDAEIDKAIAIGPLPRYYLGLAGEVLLAAGRPADGLAQLDRAIAMLDEPNVGLYLPEIYRLRGECLLTLSRRNKAKARQAFVTARDVARLQGASLFERRAETRIAEIAN